MARTLQALRRLGFSQYEARVYLALLKRHPLTGYEVAKVSRVPRPNVYSVLQRLEHRGAVLRVEREGAVRYTCVPPPELVRGLENRFHQAVEAARRAMEEVTSPPEDGYVWSIRGAVALLEHARAIIHQASQSLVLAIWPSEATALAESLRDADRRGVQMTTLCLAACARECGGCAGRIYRYRVAPEGALRWLILVEDGQEVLCGEIGLGDDGLAVRTRQRLLVDLVPSYVRHTVAVAAVLADLGGGLEGLLRPETRAILTSLARGAGEGGWLEEMRLLLSRPSAVGG